MNEQDEIDDARLSFADEIIDALRINSVEGALRVAKAWCETARQYARDANYWQERAKSAEAALHSIEHAK